LWPFLTLILNLYWFLWVIRWQFAGAVTPSEAAGAGGGE